MTVTVTPTVEASTGPQDPPRVRLDVAGTGESSTTITRLDPDGRTSPVRTADGNALPLLGGVGLLYDYEAPFGAAVSYSSVESPAVVSGSVTVDSSQVWLVHPGIPVLSMPVMVSALGPRSHKVTRAVHYPMGRPTPVVQTDGARKSAEYLLTLLTTADDERAALADILSDTGPLLLNVPVSKGWGITAEYVSVGDITENRVTRFVGEPMRTWELPLTVVDRPVGGSQSERTYVDVLVDNATYSALMPKYATYLDLLAGP